MASFRTGGICSQREQQDPTLQREVPISLAVVGVQFGHHVRPVIFQRANFRQVAGVNEDQAHRGAQHDHQQQNCECQLSGKLIFAET